MPLRAKLLFAIVFVNLVVLGALFYFLRHENARVLNEAADGFKAAFTREILRDFAELVPRQVTIDKILDYEQFDRLCRDAIIVDNPELLGRDSSAPFIQVNPLGAFHRDPDSFPRSEILRGVRTAMRQRQALPMHGGYCMPIVSGNTRLGTERLVGGGWFLPQWAVEPRLASGRILLAIGLGIVLLAGILFFSMERSVVTPLAELSNAALALGKGEVGKQVDVQSGSREIMTLVRTFNRSSAQLREHQAELARAVDDATARARRSERELILSQRLAALGTLAAGIAHEINNPLGGMMNAVNRLKKKSGESVYIELLEEGLSRIANIVRRTLDFRPRTSEPVEFRVDQAVTRAQALVSHRATGSGVRFVYEPLQDDRVLGDPHELSQVFLNLFLNSLDALEDGLRSDPRIRIEVRRKHGEAGEPIVSVLVADNGPGADPDTISRIFDPFFSTKGVTSTSDKMSAGLGMSISFSIVEHHGGTMRVESPDEGGFFVHITLPGSEAPAR